MIDLLRRAWDALDTFKQTYPENWHEDDQQVLDDLIKADLDFSDISPILGKILHFIVSKYFIYLLTNLLLHNIINIIYIYIIYIIH